MQKTIQKIHKEFDTASEKALAEAKQIVAAPATIDTAKIERFQKLGFTSGKPIKDAEEGFNKTHGAFKLIAAIEYFKSHYPFQKFITEKQIEIICKKYGLLYGDASQYSGDIPEKNLSEIEAFKLRDEDHYREEVMFEGFVNAMRNAVHEFHVRLHPRVIMQPNGDAMIEARTQFEVNPFDDDYKVKAKKEKPPFKICAPKKDFVIEAGYEIKKGYKLIYDPIVIQPVKYKDIVGGLIVSKWGLEGADQSLVNEKEN